jgi:hypothetical protein
MKKDIEHIEKKEFEVTEQEHREYKKGMTKSAFNRWVDYTLTKGMSDRNRELTNRRD